VLLVGLIPGVGHELGGGWTCVRCWPWGQWLAVSGPDGWVKRDAHSVVRVAAAVMIV
jgi:hypothetical protein